MGSGDEALSAEYVSVGDGRTASWLGEAREARFSGELIGNRVIGFIAFWVVLCPIDYCPCSDSELESLDDCDAAVVGRSVGLSEGLLASNGAAVVGTAPRTDRRSSTLWSDGNLLEASADRDAAVQVFSQ